jgi:hypothetical protein
MTSITKAVKERLPYRLREPFLSKTELALFRTLNHMMGERYIICPKVALSDLFLIVRPNENVHFFNKIFRKHVDFLLCDPKTFKPSFGVEMVKPIVKEVVRDADKFMEELFIDAGIPLVHIPSKEVYEPVDVIALFQVAVTKVDKTNPIALHDGVPNCPVCGKMMVLRINRNGKSSEKKYYGCIDSPRCRGVVAID